MTDETPPRPGAPLGTRSRLSTPVGPLSDRVADGARWVAASQAATQILRFASSVVLARLLVPADFGVVAIGMTVTMVLEQVRDLGVGASLIQRDNISRSLLNTAFYLNAATGVVLATAVILLAPDLASTLTDAHTGHSVRLQTIHVLQAFAFISLISSGANIHHALLRRAMHFRAVGIMAASSAAINTIVSVSLAVAGAGVWSIVAGLAAGNCLSVAMAWLYSTWRPGLSTKISDLQSLWRFASFLFLTNVIALVVSQSDRVIINRALGPGLLGVYAVALQITSYPLTTVTSALSEVLLPAFSRRQSDKLALRTAYLRANRVIALITFPLVAGTASVAPVLVPVVLGTKWLAVAPLLVILGPAAALRSITANAGTLMLAQGRSRAAFLSSVVFSSITVASFVLGIKWGLTGMCVAYTTAIVVLTGPLWWVAFRHVDLRLRDYARSQAPVAMITIAMVIGVLSTGQFLAAYMVPGARLVLEIILGTAIYFVLLVCIRPAAYVDALSAIKGRPGN